MAEVGTLDTADTATCEVTAAVTDLVSALKPTRSALKPTRRLTPSSTDNDVEALTRRLRRFALDVHDGPMQSIVAIGYGLIDLRARLLTSTSTETTVAEHVEVMLDELANAERDLRQLIQSFEQRETSDLEPLDAIAQGEVMRFRRLCGATVDVEASAGVQPDSHSQEIAVRSVLHEALTNIAKHANAKHVGIRLLATATEIRLEVEDDGDGFDPSTVDADRIGLASMRERLQLLGGDLAIESKRDGPTRVTASFRRWRPGLAS